MKTPLLKHILIFLIILLAIGGIFSTYNLQTAKVAKVDLTALVSQIKSEQVKKIEIDSNELHITLKDDKKEKVIKESGEPFSDVLKNFGVKPEQMENIIVEVKEDSGFTYWLGILLPFLIPFLLIGGFIYLMMRQVQGANRHALTFGRSGVKEVSGDQKNKITFKNVAGVKEAKEELKEVVEFLKNPKKFINVGAKIPKGVLLMGPPGTGKTLLARAVAGEAKVPFFYMSGSEFVEMFVGVGASRVRDLFARAKKNTPCIVFIDELDAVGRQRGAGLGGSHDEREQTLNQILVEMDGFDPNAGIILMAATNRPDVLDPALLRPGRFDRRIILDVPNLEEREEILKIHSEGKPLGPDVSLRKIAILTPGFSGADLANLLNEAAILTARRNQKLIGHLEITESIEKVMLGPERRSRILTPKEREITAYHETGHALAAHELPHADPVQKISIVSRGIAGGYTLKLPTREKYLRSKAEFLDELAVSLGGYAAEIEFFGKENVTTGASNDLREATKLAKRIVTRYGMSDTLGPRTFGEREELIFLGREISEQRDYSEKTAEAIDEEISRLINTALLRARDLLKNKKDKVLKLVKYLLEKEAIEQEEFVKLVGKKKKYDGG